jgi:hypothetical protein
MTDTSLEAAILTNLDGINRRIAAAATRCGRERAAVRLVAVSKTFSADHVRAAVAAGQRDFGENRVQEALQKIGETADTGIRWHLIGHLQSNKVRRAVGPFTLIHSVDSVDLLRRIDVASAEAGISTQVLLQVDLAGEPTKFGAVTADVERMLDAARSCRHAKVSGFMLLPPLFDDVEFVRPFFRELRTLRDGWLAAGVPGGMLRELSMGMSHDFEVAIEEGATIVRVGTAVFGVRPPRA